jgi:hypothetical protein
MGFPFEIVGVGKKKITRRSHIKYADNIDLKKLKLMTWMEIYRKIRQFKKMTH